jgi:hypothetical protein
MMMMVMMLPVPALFGGAIATTGYLIHLILGQILQWRLVK